MTGNSSSSRNSYDNDTRTATVTTPLRHGYGKLRITLQGVRKSVYIPAPEHL